MRQFYLVAWYSRGNVAVLQRPPRAGVVGAAAQVSHMLACCVVCPLIVMMTIMNNDVNCSTIKTLHVPEQVPLAVIEEVQKLVCLASRRPADMTAAINMLSLCCQSPVKSLCLWFTNFCTLGSVYNRLISPCTGQVSTVPSLFRYSRQGDNITIHSIMGCLHWFEGSIWQRQARDYSFPLYWHTYR